MKRNNIMSRVINLFKRNYKKYIIVTSLGLSTCASYYFIKQRQIQIKFPKENLIESQEILELISFVKSTDDNTIWKNHNDIKFVSGYNIDSTDVKACGVTAQAFFNMFANYQNTRFFRTKILYSIDDIDELLKNNILYVSLTRCTCCNFPGHAFIIYCFDKSCVIIQSYVNTYSHKKYIDVLDKIHVKNTLLTIEKKNSESIKAIADLTHLNHDELLGCKFNNSEFFIRFIKRRKLFEDNHSEYIMCKN